MTDHPHMNRGRAELIPSAARAGGRHGLSDRAQRHERRRGAFGQCDWCSDRPVMLLVEGCSPQGCTLTRASIRSKGVGHTTLWISDVEPVWSTPGYDRLTKTAIS